MKKRLWYFTVFIAIFAVEVCIALFVDDRIIRPYVGDVLVTVLLCCLSRTVFPKMPPALPVFGLSVAVELWQWLGLTEILHLKGTMLGAVLGSTADGKDLLCYGLGCLVFLGMEHILSIRQKKEILT